MKQIFAFFCLLFAFAACNNAETKTTEPATTEAAAAAKMKVTKRILLLGLSSGTITGPAGS